jgi:predicted acetyltransferase
MEILLTQIWKQNKRLTVEVLTANKAAVAFWRAVGYADYSLTLEIVPKTFPIASRGTKNFSCEQNRR